jgi:hypothetical protein
MTYSDTNSILARCSKGKFMLSMSVTLSKIFAPKRDGVRANWRGLPNEELYDLYSSPNIAPTIN